MTNTMTLLGDIGGTNARFAVTSSGDSSYSNFKKLHCADFDRVDEAIKYYLKDIGLSNLENIFLAVAAPIYGDKVKVVNNHWVIDKRELSRIFSVKNINLINDFESIAYAIDAIDESSYQNLGSLVQGHTKRLQYNVGIVGPGTGLGSSGLRKSKKRSIACAAELGHVGFAPQNETQKELTKVLKKKCDRVVNETFVSGPGIENIYWALHQIKNKHHERYQTEEIFNQINNNELAKQSIEIFFEMLGQVAGDFALAMGAFDGILITGNLVNSHYSLVKKSRFRFGFDNKDNYRNLMQKIPTSLINVSEIGLLGIYQFLMQKQLSES